MKCSKFERNIFDFQSKFERESKKAGGPASKRAREKESKREVRKSEGEKKCVRKKIAKRKCVCEFARVRVEKN